MLTRRGVHRSVGGEQVGGPLSAGGRQTGEAVSPGTGAVCNHNVEAGAESARTTRARGCRRAVGVPTSSTTNSSRPSEPPCRRGGPSGRYAPTAQHAVTGAAGTVVDRRRPSGSTRPDRQPDRQRQHGATPWHGARSVAVRQPVRPSMRSGAGRRARPDVATATAPLTRSLSPNAPLVGRPPFRYAIRSSHDYNPAHTRYKPRPFDADPTRIRHTAGRQLQRGRSLSGRRPRLHRALDRSRSRPARPRWQSRRSAPASMPRTARDSTGMAGGGFGTSARPPPSCALAGPRRCGCTAGRTRSPCCEYPQR